MAWARTRIRCLAGGLVLLGVGLTILLVVSLQIAVGVRGDTYEVGIGSGSLHVLLSPGGGRIIPIRTDYPPPLVHRSLELPRPWFEVLRVKGSFVDVFAPLWLLASGAFVVGGVALYLTRGPGVVRRWCARLEPMWYTSRWGRGFLVASVLCLAAMAPRSDFGFRLGKDHLISCGRGVVGMARRDKAAMVMQRSAYRWYPMPWYESGWVVVRATPERLWWVEGTAPGTSLWPMWDGDEHLCAPLWMLVVLFGVPGVLMCRRTWARPGQCIRCRYNLAGLASGAACPECGRVTGVGVAS